MKTKWTLYSKFVCLIFKIVYISIISHSEKLLKKCRLGLELMSPLHSTLTQYTHVPLCEAKLEFMNIVN